MSDIEKEAFRQIGIDLINEYRVRGGLKPIDWLVIDTPEVSAFIRSIQLHEKTKKELQGVKQELADFRQEVSKLAQFVVSGASPDMLAPLIIPAPKPDPLVEVLAQLDFLPWKKLSGHADDFRAALDALGFEIREKGK